MVKAAFHIHSNLSTDSNINLDKIEEEAAKNNISVVFLTDHDELVLPVELEKIKKVRIISGEEIKTKEGEIIGLFLKEKIESGLSPEETIKKIREQDGLVVVPHPFDKFRKSEIKTSALLRIVEQIDVVEVFNSRTIKDKYNKEALDFADKYNKLKIVGSDAHLASEIKNAFFEIEDFDGPNDFSAKIKEAKFFTKKSPVTNYIYSTAIRIFNFLR